MRRGRMLLTLIGKSSIYSSSNVWWKLLTKSLFDLVAEGLVHEASVDSLNMPYYYPCEEELRETIEDEGSFTPDLIENFELNWDFDDNVGNENFVFEKSKSGQKVANYVRALTEPMLGIILKRPLLMIYSQDLPNT
ncbi:hypothetical protein F3Y22_tig00111402pilonHSYRG00342 [Hibiscus syriacus]|uniref:Uncharacterized protein n=1 Tax=Hibiscus syriacus TaxID=106335 RepID=A0A6A2YGC6_HIBSY|nr:benzoate carboxyl methyltransferase-like [Hibiscus syriacus]KAE8678836.1 hypothetical protein F3Y22_tig00111402pilonHSYRG00342 [Hibiscus syriacus]